MPELKEEQQRQWVQVRSCQICFCGILLELTGSLAICGPSILGTHMIAWSNFVCNKLQCGTGMGGALACCRCRMLKDELNTGQKVFGQWQVKY